jgi:hypothetical protein
MPWVELARKNWGSYADIEGNGAFAVVSSCQKLSVSLWLTMEEAVSRKHQIDHSGCCKNCKPLLHTITTLSRNS